jgi:hypothetical protein
VWVEIVASTLAGAPRSPSPQRTRTAGYPNRRAHPCAHQEHARTLTHSTDRNDAPGLAYLARTGFFKPVHMRSPSAHALRSLIIALKKTGGPASDLGESDPRLGGRVREHNPSIPVARVRRYRSFRCGTLKGSNRLFADLKFGAMNGRRARESGLWRKTYVSRGAAVRLWLTPLQFACLLGLRCVRAPVRHELDDLADRSPARLTARCVTCVTAPT